jgi:peptidase M15-like protein
MVRVLTAAALVALATIVPGRAAAPDPFAVTAKGETYRDKVASLFVMPGETIALTIAGDDGPYHLVVDRGVVLSRDGGPFRWRAPEVPGLAKVTVEDERGRDRVTFNVFVLVPAAAAAGGTLNGYRIGTYPEKNRPRGFAEVTAENVRTKLSPHFELRQFLCKQAGGYPKYVVLSEALILKLERVVEALDRAGHKVDSLEIMSGYRTPYYNERIGNVRDSQHTMGTAADVFVDDRVNGVMDDLDRDGRVSRADALWLFGLVDAMDRAPNARWRGGLGDYDGTTAHGPFVHVDVRGRLARWRG